MQIREAERQKDLHKKLPEASNSEPPKTKTQQVSEKAYDMCFLLYCLLFLVFRMSCSILGTWPYGSSLMKACKKQKLEKASKQSIGSSKKDSSIFKLPEMLKSYFVFGHSDYLLSRSNISVIHVDTVQNAGRQWKIRQLHAIHRIPTVLLAKDALKNSQEKENAPIPKQKVGPCDQLFCVEF